MVEPVLIDGDWRAASASEASAPDTFRAVDPATGEPLPPIFPVSGMADVEAALDAGSAAVRELRDVPPSAIADFLAGIHLYGMTNYSLRGNVGFEVWMAFAVIQAVAAGTFAGADREPADEQNGSKKRQAPSAAGSKQSPLAPCLVLRVTMSTPFPCDFRSMGRPLHSGSGLWLHFLAGAFRESPRSYLPDLRARACVSIGLPSVLLNRS